MTKSKPMMLVSSLGICEHCQTLLSMQDMPAESISAVWKCPKCKGILSYKSFGYEITGKDDQKRDKYNKTRWVGPNGKWSNEKPKEDFNLGDWHVIINMPRFY